MKKIILFLFLVCITSISYAEIAVFDSFNGGLNSKLNPLNLPPSQADIVENIRFDTNLTSLTKRDETTVYGTADASEAITGLYRLYLANNTKVTIATHGDEIEKASDTDGSFSNILNLTYGDYRWQWVTWHNMAIGCDGYNPCIKYDGTSNSATYLGSALATDAGSGAGPNGTYNYKVTCYSSSYEISLGQTSNNVTVVDNDINLSMIPVCPATILGETTTGRKIYRNETGGSTYKILTNGAITNNTATTLTDSDADAALGATLSPTATYTVPKGRFPVVHKNRLWLANDPSYKSRIYFSEDATPDFFDPTHYFNIRQDDGDEITFAKNSLGILTISKNNTIQKIYTDEDDPDDWAISDPFSFVGCQAPYSAVNTLYGIVYLGNNGIYKFNGQNSELISDAVTPEIKDITPSNYPYVWGAFYKNKYFMTYTSFKTGASSNNRILIYDFLSNAYNIDTFSVNVLHVFGSGSDVEALYSGSSSSGKIYAHLDTTKELVHNKHSDFTGTFDDMRYIPTSIGGDANSPVLELSWDLTIDGLVGTIDTLTGSIDRPDIGGTYTSQLLTLGASSFDKLYWNETIPTEGGNVTFAVRSGATTTDTLAASWSSEYSISSGSDISAVTADSVIQYRITVSTDSVTATPTVFEAQNYVVKLTYNTSGSTDETAIGLRWRSGWLDFGNPDRVKELEKILVYYETDLNATGTFNITVENYEGDTDTFAINYYTYPDFYSDYFTSGKFIGNLFRITLDESSLNKLVIKKIVFVYKTQSTDFEYP